MNKDPKPALRPLTDVETHARRAAAIAKVGYWDADFDENILFHSSGYVTAHGLPADRVISRQEEIFDLIHPEDLKRVQEEFERVDREGIGYEIEYRVIRPSDGKIGYVREIAEPVLDENGVPVGHSGTTQDFTREKEVEIRLKAALQEAEANIHSRDLFLANMSHELRTPLNAIGGYAELLGMLGPEDLPKDKARGYVTAIHRASTHLTDIISDILLQAELQKGNREIDVRQIDAHDLIDDVIGISGLQLDEKFDKLSVDIASDDTRFSGDLRLIRQAMINLLGNAVKYAGLEKGIKIGFRRDDEGACLFVVDHGDGMSKDDADQAAEPFFRGRDALKGAVPGTGLGLSLVHRIMSLHGGRLEIDTATGKGTGVYLHFP